MSYAYKSLATCRTNALRSALKIAGRSRAACRASPDGAPAASSPASSSARVYNARLFPEAAAASSRQPRAAAKLRAERSTIPAQIMTKLTFLGAARTVTGSKYLLDFNGGRVLIDCGLFQGLKPLRLRNWEPLPFDPGSLSAVVLTHAHLDHTGYLPRLVADAYRGKIFCTPGTADLCKLVLPDSARIQEEDANEANRRH